MKKRWFLIPLSLLAVPVFAFQARMFPVLGAHPTVEERERYAASQTYNPDAEVFQNRRPELFAQMRENMEFLPMARKWFSERVDGRPPSPLPEQRITERDWWQTHTSHGLEFTAAPNESLETSPWWESVVHADS